MNKELVKDIKRVIKKSSERKLILPDVVSSLISEEEIDIMASDYIKLNCHKYDGHIAKSQRFEDYKNGLTNMLKVIELIN